jgi:L-alanine-DL-glutamate epimerase-like enolase superfamily enzyme
VEGGSRAGHAGAGPLTRALRRDARIDGFRIWTLRVPVGRTVGDNSCTYDRLNALVVQLTTRHGIDGWGYATTTSDGVFTREAWFIADMATASELTNEFEARWWPHLAGASSEIVTAPSDVTSDYAYLDGAVRNALWDIWAKVHDMPLFRVLAAEYGEKSRRSVPAYASLLDFPLSDRVAAERARMHARAGFRCVKVKVGADDAKRDLARLRAIRGAVGDAVEIGADANEAWTSSTAAAALAFFEENGMSLSYIEDPLPRDDLEGFAELVRGTDVKVVAHDYYTSMEDVRALCSRVPLARLRASSDSIDFALACVLYAREHALPVSIGNSFGEVNAHIGAAFAIVTHVEFSDLSWARLLTTPTGQSDGYLIPPAVAGAGLNPRRTMLERLQTSN